MTQFDNFLIAMNIAQEERKRALLLYYGGFELQDVFESLTDTGTTYAELTAAFADYFDPKTNECFEIWNFQKTTQEEGETIQMYYLRLKETATRCAFTDVNKAITTQLILGTISSSLRKYCFTNKTATLQDILNRGKLMEDIEFQIKEMTIKQEPIQEKSREQVKALQDELAELKLQINQTAKGKKNTQSRYNKSCFNCGHTYPHEGICPAKGKTCHSCGKLNHFSKVCRSSRQKPPSMHPQLIQ